MGQIMNGDIVNDDIGDVINYDKGLPFDGNEWGKIRRPGGELGNQLAQAHGVAIKIFLLDMNLLCRPQVSYLRLVSR